MCGFVIYIYADECIAVLVQKLNVRRDAVGVNHHGHNGHPRESFGGSVT
jgi:hypothetical protein